ncbi:MAG: KpsF/GutQ family sugar-phosphate isomerase [Synergistaceae bacterium]|nr:KpsF/GutQ family sugar-phosphate isomerase [Synergistaceae bacterium]
MYGNLTKDIEDDELLTLGRRIIIEESRAMKAASARMGGEMARAARLVASCGGRVVVSGLGKSGHVGRKIAATLASLGVPAFFLHASEASHGDLGMVRPEDVGLLMSNSGETEEVLSLLPYFRRIGAPVIGMTGKMSSTLALNSDITLDAGAEKEADPLGLAPTSSTSVQMAIGDALAGVCAKLRGFCPEEYAIFHPGGMLGRRLLLRVSDIMGKGEAMPETRIGSSVKEALFEITSKGYGATAIVDAEGKLCGVFTDGDLRRLMEHKGVEAIELPVEEGMTRSPRTIAPEKLATEAVRMMEVFEISVLIAVEDGHPVGMVHLHEILKSGIS